MHCDSHLQVQFARPGFGGEVLLDFQATARGRCRGPENRQHAVAFTPGLYPLPLVVPDGGGQDFVMADHGGSHCLGLTFPGLRRPPEVGEHERDGALREWGLAAMTVTQTAARPGTTDHMTSSSIAASLRAG